MSSRLQNIKQIITENGQQTLLQIIQKVFFNNSKWCAGLDETTVFNTQITHKQGSGDKNWTMRVGNGGQIYSLVTPLGEMIPLQNGGAEWMDEVWQIVVTSSSRMIDRNTPALSHFIHQAGMYKQFDKNKKAGRNYMDDTFYSPRLAKSGMLQPEPSQLLIWALHLR